MKAKELRNLSDSELSSRLAETKKELTTLQIKHNSSATGVEKPVRLRLLRREVARMLTIQTEREAKK